MKKILCLIFIYVPIALFSEDAREQRWIDRVEKLEKYKSEFSSKPEYEAGAAALIDEEIKSANEFIAVLKKYKTGDDSVKAINRHYSVEEIEALSSDITSPVISVFYISDMLKNSCNHSAVSPLKDEICKYASASGFPVLNRESRTAEILARGYYIEKYMSEYDSLKKQAASDILSAAEYELSRTGYNSNEIDIKEIIAASAWKVCSGGIGKNTEFNPEYLKALPEWNEYTLSSAGSAKRTDSALLFAESRGIKLTPDEKKRGLQFIENRIFFDDRSLLITMAENTAKAESTGHNNPSYEIPDFKGIKSAVEDIDKYRKTLTTSMNGGEDADFIKRVKSNNNGIANKYIAQYENFFKREKLRISRLRQSGSKGIIYNEEIFNTSEKHFADMKERLNAYAALSSDYLESLYSSWKLNPDEFISMYNRKTGKHLDYLSFMERLTADSVPAAKISGVKLNALHRAGIKELLNLMKSLSTPEAIPADVRKTMKKEQVTGYSGINDNLRTKGSALILSAKKNFESYTTAYSETVSAKKNGTIESETSIGQDEIDRLMSCAKKYSAAAASMNYTAGAMKKYADQYIQISDEIRNGGDLTKYLEQVNSGSIIPLVNDFSPEKIDREMKTRDILVKEGNESLSGAVALSQYYSRRGFGIKYVYTADEIKKIRDNFAALPEVTVSSWKMNGRNYRLVDTNATESLKKMLNKKAWGNQADNGSKGVKEIFSVGGTLNFSLSLPGEWQRSKKKEDGAASLYIEYRSPDQLGKIIVRALKYDKGDIQLFSDEWIKSNGFSPVSKNRSKIKGADYLMTVSKNRHDSIMDSYVLLENGYIVLISGTAEKKRYSSLNKNLKEIFSTLEI